MIVLAHAKVNFTLEVLSLRSDGYHGLRSVVLPISLCDTVELDESEGFSSDSGFADDLCLKAARATDARRGVRVRVTKRIPVGGGLGGGSADAAAVIRGLNEMRGLGKSPAELAEIGASVGSDVPALVLNAPVLMEGRGEKVVPIAAGSMDLVLVDPGVHCSTGEVYSACRPRADAGASKTAQMVAALSSGGFDEVVAALANDLQEPAMRLHPEIAAARDALRAAGAAGVLMSGSGSCVFGPVRDAATAAGIAGELRARGHRAMAVRTIGSNMI